MIPKNYPDIRKSIELNKKDEHYFKKSAFSGFTGFTVIKTLKSTVHLLQKVKADSSIFLTDLHVQEGD